MIIYKKYFFDAAHFLTDFKKNHKYSKVHGHSYEMTVQISGKINKNNCWVIDFEEIDKIVKPIVDKLDHQTLNEIEGLENPTSENIARWLWERIKLKIKNLESIEINRPRIGGCVYRGE